MLRRVCTAWLHSRARYLGVHTPILQPPARRSHSMDEPQARAVPSKARPGDAFPPKALAS